MAATALILFWIIFTQPFIEMTLYGRKNETHLLSAIQHLSETGYWFLSLIGFLCIFVFPLIQISMVGLIHGLLWKKHHVWIPTLMKWNMHLRSWAMIDVFLLGFFVAYIKLKELSHIDLGYGAYALGALTLTLILMHVFDDPKFVWDSIKPITQTENNTNCCTVCYAMTPENNPRCIRCHSKVWKRKPNSIKKATALLVAASIFYIPANTYPIMTVLSLGQGNPSTILGGVKQLIHSGMWILAFVVFFASVFVPLLKLLSLAIMVLTVRYGWTNHLNQKTHLYRLIEFIGRWSMIDIFMVAILTGVVQLDMIGSVTPGLGAVFFAAVVILTMFASHFFDPRLMWDSKKGFENNYTENANGKT